MTIMKRSVKRIIAIILIYLCGAILAVYGQSQPGIWDCDKWLKVFLNKNVFHDNSIPLHLFVQTDIYSSMSEESIIMMLRQGYRDTIASQKDPLFPSEEDYVNKALPYAIQRNANQHRSECRRIYISQEFVRVLVYSNCVASPANLQSDKIWISKIDPRGYTLYNVDHQTKKVSSKYVKAPSCDYEYQYYGTLSPNDVGVIKMLLNFLGNTAVTNADSRIVERICKSAVVSNEDGQVSITLQVDAGGDKVKVEVNVRCSDNTSEVVACYIVDKHDARTLYNSVVKRMPENMVVSSAVYSDFVKLSENRAYPSNIVIERYEKNGNLKSRKDIKVELVEIMPTAAKEKAIDIIESYGGSVSP